MIQDDTSLAAGGIGGFRCRTVGAVKSRWFREIKPWRESEPTHVVNKKVQEGKRLAFEKYKSLPT